MISVACAVALAAALTLDRTQAGPPEPAPVKRIVSINLCADQYLLALAAPGQILALSPFAADPSLSFLASRAKGIRRVRDDAESVLLLKPDLVVASAYNSRAALDVLRRHGVDVLMLSHPERLEEVAAQIERVAAAIGRRAEGERLLRRYRRALMRAKGVAPTGLSALYYDRGGYVLGTRTLVAELMAHVGLENAARRLGVTAAAPVSVESVLFTRPDLLIVPGQAGAIDQGLALLRHPALARLYPREKRIVLPGRLTVCPGPSVIAALDTLVTEILRVVRALPGGNS